MAVRFDPHCYSRSLRDALVDFYLLCIIGDAQRSDACRGSPPTVDRTGLLLGITMPSYHACGRVGLSREGALATPRTWPVGFSAPCKRIVNCLVGIALLLCRANCCGPHDAWRFRFGAGDAISRERFRAGTDSDHFRVIRHS